MQESKTILCADKQKRNELVQKKNGAKQHSKNEAG